MAKATLPSACTEALTDHLNPEFFKALCDANRLSLLAQLATSKTPLNVTDLSGCCGAHISGVSRHLALLRRAGLVVATKQGREVVYHLDSNTLVSTLRGLADAVEQCCATAQCCGPNQPSTDSAEDRK